MAERHIGAVRMTGLYTYIDRPVTALADGSRLLVWSLRIWAHAVARRTCQSAMLAEVYGRLGLIDALADMQMSAAILNGHARATLTLSPPCGSHVAEHEALLLALWADAAAGRTVQARAIVDALVRPDMTDAFFNAMRLHAAKIAPLGLDPRAIPHPFEDHDHE